MKHARLLALLLPFTILFGCDSSKSDPLPDAGAPRDSGLRPDVGPRDSGFVDSGPRPDAQAPDLGPEADSGEPVDLGGPVDAGEPPDLGEPIDAGTTTATSCLAIKSADANATTGVYEIDVEGESQPVFCDMELEGGGWTLALLKNSAHDGNYPDFGASPTNLAALAANPIAASTSTIGVAGWLDLNASGYSELRLAAYANGSRSFLSEAISRSSLRIPFGQPGYLLYDDPNGYYWCGGPISYTDQGSGQVDTPVGAPSDCKTHTVLGSGWDFGGQSYNTSMTMCGSDGYGGMLGGGPIGNGGSWVFYPSAGVAYAIWIR